MDKFIDWRLRILSKDWILYGSCRISPFPTNWPPVVIIYLPTQHFLVAGVTPALLTPSRCFPICSHPWFTLQYTVTMVMAFILVCKAYLPGPCDMRVSYVFPGCYIPWYTIFWTVSYNHVMETATVAYRTRFCRHKSILTCPLQSAM